MQGTKFKRNGIFLHNNIVHKLTGPKINCFLLCITRLKQKQFSNLFEAAKISKATLK